MSTPKYPDPRICGFEYGHYEIRQQGALILVTPEQARRLVELILRELEAHNGSPDQGSR